MGEHRHTAEEHYMAVLDILIKTWEDALAAASHNLRHLYGEGPVRAAGRALGKAHVHSAGYHCDNCGDPDCEAPVGIHLVLHLPTLDDLVELQARMPSWTLERHLLDAVMVPVTVYYEQCSNPHPTAQSLDQIIASGRVRF